MSPSVLPCLLQVERFAACQPRPELHTVPAHKYAYISR
jgi:hypothetical protein